MMPTQEFLDSIKGEGILLENQELEKLILFLDCLYEKNKQINLTSITDPEEAWMRHCYDSLTLFPYLNEINPNKVIDLGSGGGFPGIPLAITQPSVHFTLLESTQKKANFLKEVSNKLDLKNIKIVSDRAENVGSKSKFLRSNFDVVVARAVSSLPVLLELSIPLLKVGGFLVAIKGKKYLEEIKNSTKALKVLKSNVTITARTKTGSIIVVEKIGEIPAKYPRRSGEPKRDPIS